jgi:hypothetical protein
MKVGKLQRTKGKEKKQCNALWRIFRLTEPQNLRCHYLGIGGRSSKNYVQTLGERRHIEEMVAQCTIVAHPRCYYTYKFRY